MTIYLRLQDGGTLSFQSFYQITYYIRTTAVLSYNFCKLLENYYVLFEVCEIHEPPSKAISSVDEGKT